MDKKTLLDIKQKMIEFLSRSSHFWMEKSPDREFGGFLVCFDEHGNPMTHIDVMEPTDKMIVTQTRMIWGIAALLRNDMYQYAGLDYSSLKLELRKSVDSFISHFWDEEKEGFVWYTNRQGKVMDYGKLVYGQTFVVYAMAEAALAVPDENYIEYAIKAYESLLKNCTDLRYGGFYENLSRDWVPETEQDFGGNLKSLDIHMHALEAFSNLYEFTKSEDHRLRLKEVIHIITEHMVDYKYGCGGNQYDDRFAPKDARSIRRTWNYERDPEQANANPLDTTSFGHNIELAWLLNKAYKVMDEERPVAFTKMIADYVLVNGVDKEYGGIFRDGMHDGRVVNKEKEWWQNFEALTGFLDAYEVTGDERYLTEFVNLFTFVWTYFYNEEVGESRQLLEQGGTPKISDVGNQWKCMYHTDRAMMECIVRINNILNP